MAAAPFAMAIPQRPFVGKGESSRYQQGLRDAAKKFFPAGPLNDVPLYSRIIWFHAVAVKVRSNDPDIDNILKPIHDSLKGIVYTDDFLIRKCFSQRVDASLGVSLPPTNIVKPACDELASLLSDTKHKHVLYIEVGVDTGTLAFGEIA